MKQTQIISLNDIQNQEPQYLETIFSLSNGHFGVRASDPLTSSNTAGTVVNGFYATSPIVYGEAAYGYAKQHQTIVQLPDFRALQIMNDSGAKFMTTKVISKELNLTSGLLTEEWIAEDSNYHRLKLRLDSIIDQTDGVEYAVRYRIKALNTIGKVRLKKELKMPSTVVASSDDPRKAHTVPKVTTVYTPINNQELTLELATQSTQQNLQLKMYVSLGRNYTTILDEGDEITGDMIINVSKIGGPQIKEFTPFNELLKFTTAYWQSFWNTSEVQIDGDGVMNKAIHYNLFQLMSSSGRDGKTNVAAKGLSGTGYEGHYFWDSEMYILPFLTFTNPMIARQLLKYRYSILPLARQRARKLGVKNGALFAWRTINGEEASAYFPAGTAQYHINGDIAYAVKNYYDVTGDKDFMKNFGLELLIETARFWQNFGSWSKVNGMKKFCFFDVTGPDEYTAIVNNNYYTNHVAKANFESAIEFSTIFPETAKKLLVTKAERATWKRIAQEIYLPYSKQLRINEQDDSAFQKPIWPFSDTPKKNYPLLLHYHPLTIYRYQVNKQADTLLADYLFDDIDKNQLQREYNYYERITTHDSSLSRSIFSALAARLDNVDKSYSYFIDTARMDLTNLQGNSCDGLHIANLGGSWLAIAMGFGGVQIKSNTLIIQNRLPKQWRRLIIRFTYHERLLEIVYTATETNVKLLKGASLRLVIDGETHLIQMETEKFCRRENVKGINF